MGIFRFLPDRNSRIVRWGGYALLAIALGYCAVAISRLGTHDLLKTLTPQAWSATILVGIAYGAALWFLAVGWGGVAANGARFRLNDRLAVYGPGVIAKYIPGSVFQYGSRQLLGADYGLEQKAMAKASLFEAGLHIFAAFAAGVLLLAGGGAIALALLALLGLALMVRGGVPLIRALGGQLVFFCAFAFLVALVARIALGLDQAYLLSGIFMLAWIAGFLVPVAPGGLGVRESALLALTAHYDAGASLAAFALLTRLSTSIGDAGFGLGAYCLLLSRRWNRHASS